MLLRRYGTATQIQFALITAGGTDFESGATFASGDVQISKDGGAFANATNSPSHIGNGIYALNLTATEMEAKNVVVTVIDQDATKVFEDQMIPLSTLNNASAEIPTVSGDAPTAAAVADQVWDEAKADHTGTGSFGEEMQLHALSSEVPGAADNASAVWGAATREVTGVASAGRNEIADSILTRDVDQVEATAPVHSLTGAILKLVSRFVASTGKTYKTNGTDEFMTQSITTDDAADPVSEIGAAS